MVGNHDSKHAMFVYVSEGVAVDNGNGRIVPKQNGRRFVNNRRLEVLWLHSELLPCYNRD